MIPLDYLEKVEQVGRDNESALRRLTSVRA